MPTHMFIYPENMIGPVHSETTGLHGDR